LKKVLCIVNEVYSRVVGYYRPIGQWNDGKKQEFKERYFSDANFTNEKREELKTRGRRVKKESKKTGNPIK
jgi:hypothetical protein